MLNTQISTATNGNTTPNNGKITVSQTTLPTHELINLKDTLDNLTTAFDDIATVVSMLLYGDLPPFQQQALLRLIQSHAYEYMGLCENTTDELKERLGGVR